MKYCDTFAASWSISALQRLPQWRPCWVEVCWWRSPLPSPSSPSRPASLRVPSVEARRRRTLEPHAHAGRCNHSGCFMTTQMLLPVSHFLSLTLTHVGFRPQRVTRLFLEFFRQVQAGQLRAAAAASSDSEGTFLLLERCDGGIKSRIQS